MELKPEDEKKDATPRTYRELLGFMFRRIVATKKFYLIPVWILLAAIALVLVLSGNAHLLPAIYLAF
jgi:hypothetical protein